MRAAAAYDAYLRSLGWDDGDRAPRNARTRFATKFLSFPSGVATEGNTREVALAKWHRLWRSSTTLQLNTTTKLRKRDERKRGANATGRYGQRQRAAGKQGKPHTAACVRSRLYEWFMSMRYSIDWKKYNES